MGDYKDWIGERYDDLCNEFEEAKGRRPTKEEEMKLWEEAKDYVDGRLCDRADAMRKEAKGE